MMPTCLAIITTALRKAKILGVGETPSDDEAQDALEELKGLYSQWASNGLFGRITDVATSEDYEAKENERITVRDGATITLPETISDDGTEYPPYELSLVEVVDIDAETVTRYLYTLGSWTDLNTLVLGDEAPLGSRDASGLAACLALPLADEYGGQIGPGVARQAAAFKTALSLKLGSDAPRAAPDYF